jgi:hypothetical protein
MIRAILAETKALLRRISSQDFGKSVSNSFPKKRRNRVANLFHDLRAIPGELEIVVKGL